MTNMDPSTLFGYTDKVSYRAGEQVAVMADVATQQLVRAELIWARLGGSDLTLSGPQVDWDGAGEYTCSPQRHCIGSFVSVPDALGDLLHDSVTVGAWVWATRLDSGEPQGVLGALTETGSGWRLTLEGHDLSLWAVFGQKVHRVAHIPGAMTERTWHLVSVTIDNEGVHLSVDRMRCPAASTEAHAGSGERSIAKGLNLTIGAGGAELVKSSPAGARGIPIWPFNGKISQPFALGRALSAADRRLACLTGKLELIGDPHLLGAWDFAPRVGERMHVRDMAGRHDGLLVNLPVGGVTGPLWSGEALSFEARPLEYAALRFNDDAIFDIGWETLISAELPSSLRSGVYALRVSGASEEDAIPIVVRPRQPNASILVLLPTFTYLAYANEHMFESGHSEGMSDFAMTLERRDLARQGAGQYGLSTYDRHSDGQGVIFSSARRAILTDRLDYAAWHAGLRRSFSGDMYLVEWLQRKGFSFDVATDLDLHQDGPGLLDGYAVVITGAHPEYYSAQMLQAVETFRDDGGKLMYLGGNGFYQVTGVYSEDPLVIEVRRGHAGVRTWESEPGEGYLISSGEPGGLWRYRGRAPQRLVGVGMGSQGGDAASPYRRTPESYGPALAWLFEGVEGDLIGRTGLSMGAAAGDELDRVDELLGTPPEAVVLARSFGHSDFFQRAIEEVPAGRAGAGGGTSDPEVRADMTYFEVAGGGAVFSVGSIAWMGSLLTEDTDPSVSRVTENVLRRFAGLSPTPRGPER